MTDPFALIKFHSQIKTTGASDIKERAGERERERERERRERERERGKEWERRICFPFFSRVEFEKAVVHHFFRLRLEYVKWVHACEEKSLHTFKVRLKSL
jgi:hypothetical protein